MNNGTQWMYIREDRELYQHCNFKVFSRKMKHVVSRLYEIDKQFPVFFAMVRGFSEKHQSKCSFLKNQ